MILNMSLVDTSLVRDFKAISDTHGLQESAQEVLRELGITEIFVKGSPPKQGPTLIVSNHPGSLDGFVMLATISREDCYYILINAYQVMGEKLKLKMFPIYSRRKKRDHIFKLFLQRYIEQSDDLPKDIMQEKNRDSITKAAQKVDEGNAVVIFPGGSAGAQPKGRKWKVGVGYLVEQIKNKDTRIVFADIRGTHKPDVLRYIHAGVRKVIFRRKKIQVIFSEPEKLSEYQKYPPKEIAQKLEERFNNLF